MAYIYLSEQWYGFHIFSTVAGRNKVPILAQILNIPYKARKQETPYIGTGSKILPTMTGKNIIPIMAYPYVAWYSTDSNIPLTIEQMTKFHMHINISTRKQCGFQNNPIDGWEKWNYPTTWSIVVDWHPLPPTLHWSLWNNTWQHVNKLVSYIQPLLRVKLNSVR